MMTVNGAEIGHTIYDGTSIAIKDYSRKDRDEFGNVTLIERGYSYLINYAVEVDPADIPVIKETLAKVRAQVATFVGHPDLPEINVTGYLNSFNIPLSSESVTTITIEVESELLYDGVIVVFDLAGGTRTGGGQLTQYFPTGTSVTPVAPTLLPPTGKVFSAWDTSLSGITANTKITATYTDA